MFTKILTRGHTEDLIKSSVQIHNILIYERRRADRSGHEFSIVVFDTLELGKNHIFQNLCDIIKIRKNTIDELGWFNNSQLCLVMPYTSMKEAKDFIKDIFKDTQISKKIMFEVFSYPFNTQEYAEIDTSSKHFHHIESLLAPEIPIWKRTMDLIFVMVTATLLSPVFILICLYIKIISPGPIFFTQDRVGFLKKNFKVWKFRTMYVNADTALHLNHVEDLIKNGKPLAKIEHDKRIIPCGNILRLLCLDEFAQLINVARGEMSVVGPRPDVPYSVKHYKQWHQRRFDTLPGLTGLWQVTGKNNTTLEEMMRLDIQYIEERSFWLDCKIILMTVPAIIDQIFECVSKHHIEEPAYTH